MNAAYPTLQPDTLHQRYEGEIVEFSIAPVLPAGMSTNLSTGIIEGAPVELEPKATYNVIAKNETGSFDTELVFIAALGPDFGNDVCIKVRRMQLKANDYEKIVLQTKMGEILHRLDNIETVLSCQLAQAGPKDATTEMLDNMRAGITQMAAQVAEVESFKADLAQLMSGLLVPELRAGEAPSMVLTPEEWYTKQSWLEDKF